MRSGKIARAASAAFGYTRAESARIARATSGEVGSARSTGASNLSISVVRSATRATVALAHALCCHSPLLLIDLRLTFLLTPIDTLFIYRPIQSDVKSHKQGDLN